MDASYSSYFFCVEKIRWTVKTKTEAFLKFKKMESKKQKN